MRCAGQAGPGVLVPWQLGCSSHHCASHPLTPHCLPVLPRPVRQREEERKAAAAALLAEVAAGNAELAARKREQQRAEAEEAQRIAEYIRARDAREQARGAVGVAGAGGWCGNKAVQWFLRRPAPAACTTAGYSWPGTNSSIHPLICPSTSPTRLPTHPARSWPRSASAPPRPRSWRWRACGRSRRRSSTTALRWWALWGRREAVGVEVAGWPEVVVPGLPAGLPCRPGSFPRR